MNDSTTSHRIDSCQSAGGALLILGAREGITDYCAEICFEIRCRQGIAVVGTGWLGSHSLQQWGSVRATDQDRIDFDTACSQPRRLAIDVTLVTALIRET